jgi:K+-sensing histidine kinase KdpD
MVGEGFDAPPPPTRRKGVLPSRFRAYAFAFLLVAASGLIAELVYRQFGITRLSPVFLAAVLVSAVTLGARPALFAAVLAFAAYNFYLVEPRFTLRLDSPEEMLMLPLFLTVALLTGGLAGRVRDEADRSKARARTMAILFEASRQLSSTDEEDALRQHLAEHIAAAAKGEAQVLYGGRTWAAGSSGRGTADEGWSERPLLADGVDLGEARWRPADAPPAGTDEVQGLMRVLVDLGASAIARNRLAAEKSQVETIARTERLRTALLASVSHDFRTPLTAILTSTTSLRTFGDRFNPGERDDLLSTIQEEAERLNGYVANLLSFTKLEAGALEAERAPIHLHEIVGRLLKRYRSRAGGRVLALNLGPEPLDARGDAFLLEQALSNVLENAIRFSVAASIIEIRARRDAAAVVIEILDEGPGVPAGEEERIFEKFYRCGVTPHQGTGLGLSIAKGMVEAMGGRIAARGRPGGVGLCVWIELPARPSDEP